MKEVSTQTNDAPATKRPGRPPGSSLPPEQRKSEMIRCRVTPAMLEKYEELGGENWLRERIKLARGSS